ncbi:tail fiber assembly protein [Aeromonas sp. R5-2]|uniref:tail fiber assembly protein n=1 Tax=Aeromonas sp. R5-2 TaxID=3138468 RepID=UPI0034A1FE4D
MEITVLAARNVLARAEQPDTLEMEVLFSHYSDNYLPFTASRDDSVEYGRELYYRAIFGEFGPITKISAALPTEAEQQSLLDGKLQQAATAMAPLEDADKLGIISEVERERLTAWQRYRVALYRLPQGDGWPSSVTWPELPQ